MKDEKLLGPWVRRFLLEHLVAERNLSRNTQASYRDALALLLPFVSKQAGVAIDRMTVEDLTPSIIRTRRTVPAGIMSDAAGGGAGLEGGSGRIKRPRSCGSTSVRRTSRGGGGGADDTADWNSILITSETS